jgi:RNA polymerase sigma factor (TIGR02999 family)
MDDSPKSEVTAFLVRLRAGGADPHGAADRAFESIYGELRRLATALMRGERPGHTLQPTALVHEAYLRLVGDSQVEWQSRAHFFRIAARAMRRILVDHGRGRAAAKRAGGWQRVTLDQRLDLRAPSEVKILRLEEALTRLDAMDARMARVAEMRILTGMTVKEVAHVLAVSPRTIDSDWRVARSWLTSELAEDRAS